MFKTFSSYKSTVNIFDTFNINATRHLFKAFVNFCMFKKIIYLRLQFVYYLPPNYKL